MKATLAEDNDNATAYVLADAVKVLLHQTKARIEVRVKSTRTRNCYTRASFALLDWVHLMAADKTIQSVLSDCILRCCSIRQSRRASATLTS